MNAQTFAGRVCLLGVGLCMGVLSLRTAWAVTVTNNGNLIFEDNFDNDALGSLPVIGAGDTGISWTQFTREAGPPGEFLNDVEDDTTSLVGTSETRAGRYLSVENMQVGAPLFANRDGEIYARFPSQTSGTLAATFGANIFQNGSDGSAVRVAFTQGVPVVNADDECCEISHRHTAYIMTAGWATDTTAFPAALDNNDVVIAFLDQDNVVGNGNVFNPLEEDVVGGTVEDRIISGACIDCAGKWITVTMTQEPSLGSQPVFTVNGKTLKPVPYANNGPLDNGNPAIDGIQFGANTRFAGYIDSALAGPPAITFTWAGGTLGDWNESSNWSPPNGAPPNSNDHTAIFANSATGPTNVSVMSDVTVNKIEFDNSLHPYIISGSGSVNLEDAVMFLPPTPRIVVRRGSHQFQARVGLNDDATVEVSGGSALELVNRLSLNGNTLTKAGDGTLLINSSFNTGAGTIINDGGLIAGGGTVGGDLNNVSGTVSPGISVSGQGNSQAVPEPGAIGLLLLASAACVVLRWNRVHRRVD